MHSADVGYVPRKVSVLLAVPVTFTDLFPFRWGFMVIFWNFAGVPFVSRRGCSIALS
jgi:hypothetical protein